MRTREKHLDREIRIELLRAQAAVERGELCRQLCSLNENLRPPNLFSSFSGYGQGSTIGRLVRLLTSSSTRYPMLISLVSAVAGGVGGKGMKLGAVGLLMWRVARVFMGRSARQKASAARSSRVIGPYK